MYNSKPTHHQKYQAYATASMTVSKLRQVIMLYDGAIRFVQQSIEAIEKQDYTTRYNQLTKTSEILMGLQGALDYVNGGEIADLLYNYYASLDARIFSVHRTNNVKVLEGVLKELRMMRESWNSIEQAERESSKDTVDPAAIPAKIDISGVGVSA